MKQLSTKQYDAFISYRHLPLDKAVAKKLQSLLEQVKPPKDLDCKNTRKISRIFRDESELPTSGDLGSDLISALENSSYLIVLCSPKLKESKWCMAEIEHFKKLHGGRINRILPVLVDGDPSETFPDSIRFDTRITIDEHGDERAEVVEVEPLACNIAAGGDIRQTLRKLRKSEFLRIAAPILGCSFDDLYRRHRRRKIQQAVAVASFSAVLASVVLAVFVAQNRSMVEHRDTMYAELSASAYASGRIPDAISYAKQALQPRHTIMPGFLPQAREALTTALGVYDLSDGYRPFETLALPSRTLNIAISGDGRTAAAVCAFEVVVFDTATAQVITSFNTVRSALAEAEFLNDTTLLFAGENGLTAYDIARGEVLWVGEMATGITISADSTTIAAIYRDEGRAVIYSSDGTQRGTVQFTGRSQRVIYNDIFANPNRNLFALNADGSLLAVSFDGSAITVFDTADTNWFVEIPGTDEYIAFTGGFYGNYFAFSAAREGFVSIALIIDMAHLEQVFLRESGSEFMVLANEHGIFISNENIILQIDPTHGTQQWVANTNADVLDFALGEYGTIVSTVANNIEVFDTAANRLSVRNFDHLSDFVAVSSGYAVTASRNTAEVGILERTDRTDSTMFTYNAEHPHEQTRVNAAHTRVMRFSPRGFRLYDAAGGLIAETQMQDHMQIIDQQFSEYSGNLAVIYRTRLRIYSGYDGSLLFERGGMRTGNALRSIFFAPYGISIFDRNMTLSLIDVDTAQAVVMLQPEGEFAAYAGMVVDSAFLGQRELIGAARHGDGYLFAVSDGEIGTVYDHTGSRRFEISTGQHSEAHFTETAVVISPLHGTAIAYSLQDGSQIRTLDVDAFLTYVHQLNEYIVIEYITAQGERFATLTDADFQTIAHLPGLTDIDTQSGLLLFDHGLGTVRSSPIFSLEELKAMATARGF